LTERIGGGGGVKGKKQVPRFPAIQNEREGEKAWRGPINVPVRKTGRGVVNTRVRIHTRVNSRTDRFTLLRPGILENGGQAHRGAGTTQGEEWETQIRSAGRR